MALSSSNTSTQFNHILNAQEDEIVSLPENFIAAQGGFEQAGSDLIVTGETGETLLIQNFYTMQPSGIEMGTGFMSFELTQKLASSETAGQYAQAAPDTASETIGQIETSEGVVSAFRADGTSVTLQIGDPIYQGDVIRTGEDASVGITFNDDSSFSLDENGEIILDEMVYDPDSGDGAFSSTLTSGVFSFVSGQIAKANPDAMSITTPVATIGIRGTQGVIKQDSGGGMEAALLEETGGITGELILTNGGGTVVLNQPNQFSAIISFTSTPTQPVIITSAQITGSFGNKVLRVLSQTRQRMEERKAEEQAQEQPQEGEGAEAQGEGEGEGEGQGGEEIVVELDTGEDIIFFIPPPLSLDLPIPPGDIIDEIIKEIKKVIDNRIDNIQNNTKKQIVDALDNVENFVTTGVSTGNDTLYGTNQNDGIAGLAGDDEIHGYVSDSSDGSNSGVDIIVGGDGNDTIWGGDGNDFIHGDTPTLAGNYKDLATFAAKLGVASLGDTNSGGNDRLYGMAGNDVMDGGYGADTLDGGNGNDTLSGGYDIDYLIGGYGDDTLNGGDNNDTLDGGYGNDHLYGDAGGDTILGEAGNDTIEGGAGADIIYGDDESSGGSGADLISGGTGNDTIHAGGGNDTITGGDGADSINGNDGNDVISGGAEADTISGGSGSDTVQAGSGNDTITADNDSYNDTYDGGTGDDTLTYALWETTITVNVSGEKTGTVTTNTPPTDYYSDIEAIIASAVEDTINISSSAALTSINGGDGNDTVNISGGTVDIVAGGAGNDVFNFTTDTHTINTKVSGDGNDDTFNFTKISSIASTPLDGGTGSDTLRFNNAAADAGTVSLSSSNGIDITNIDIIDITGNAASVDNTIYIDTAGVTGNGINTLTINGDTGDTVSFNPGDSWTTTGMIDNNGYKSYTSSGKTVQVYVGSGDNQISVNGGLLDGGEGSA